MPHPEFGKYIAVSSVKITDDTVIENVINNFKSRF